MLEQTIVRTLDRHSETPSRSCFAPTCTSADATAQLSVALYRHLTDLHGLPENTEATVARAAAGLPCIRAMSLWGPVSRVLFEISLDGEDPDEVLIAEVAACYACDLEPKAESISGLEALEIRRALWAAAVIRLAEAAVLDSRGEVTGVHAAWTDTHLHVEFDGVSPQRDISRVANHAAAMEMLSGRSVVVTSSRRRRCYAA